MFRPVFFFFFFWKIHATEERRKTEVCILDLDMRSFAAIFNHSKTFHETTITDQCPSLADSTDFVQHAQAFLLLLSHIEQISWSTLRLSPSTDGFLVTLHHCYVDMGDRAHDLHIDIPRQWPQERPRCRAQLPMEFTIESWCPKTSRLIEIIQSFHDAIDSLQPFWNQLMDIERDAIVLDQPPISYASTTRRLKIDEHVHVQVQVRLCIESNSQRSQSFRSIRLIHRRFQ